MSGRCPQDGGFIGDAGCSHPNHGHSELVRGLLASKPRAISPREADAALREGSFAYARDFGDFKMLVLTDEHGNVEDTFDIIPKRKG